MANYKTSIPVAMLRRRNPFLALQDELDRTIDSFYNFTGVTPERWTGLENANLSPSVDIIDDKDIFKIEAEMPGMGEEDVRVSINDGILTIKGEKEVSTKNEGRNYLSREISYGRYERSIALPDSADVGKAKASFKKGMLWVEIPKKAESVKRSHELKVEKAPD